MPDIEIVFTYRDVQYAVDDAMFERARKLFTSGKVTNLSQSVTGFSAEVVGTHSYRVHVAKRGINYGMCDCYMGQNDTLCKHMVAVGIAALYMSKLADEQGRSVEKPPESLADRKQLMAAGMRKITGYNGPSSTWVAYQSRLDAGASMIRESMLGLEPSRANAIYLWGIVKRIDRKLQSNVDDSNGTVWPIATEAVATLAEWSTISQEFHKEIQMFTLYKTTFDFTDELLQKIDKVYLDKSKVISIE